jgi:hypothetical protein
MLGTLSLIYRERAHGIWPRPVYHSESNSVWCWKLSCQQSRTTPPRPWPERLLDNDAIITRIWRVLRPQIAVIRVLSHISMRSSMRRTITGPVVFSTWKSHKNDGLPFPASTWWLTHEILDCFGTSVLRWSLHALGVVMCKIVDKGVVPVWIGFFVLPDFPVRCCGIFLRNHFPVDEFGALWYNCFSVECVYWVTCELSIWYSMRDPSHVLVVSAASLISPVVLLGTAKERHRQNVDVTHLQLFHQLICYFYLALVALCALIFVPDQSSLLPQFLVLCEAVLIVNITKLLNRNFK